MKQKSGLGLHAEYAVLLFISLCSRTWNLPLGKTNYNIGLVLLFLIVFFCRPALTWDHFPSVSVHHSCTLKFNLAAKGKKAHIAHSLVHAHTFIIVAVSVGSHISSLSWCTQWA